MNDQKNEKKILEGVLPAVISPMKENGDVNYRMLENQVAYLSQEAITGLLLNGTTGEGAFLSTKEKVEIVRAVKNVVNNQIILCAACIKPTTKQVIKELKAHEKVQPDYFVAVTPYYLHVSQKVIFDHFKEIASVSSAPLIVYNIPQNTHNPVDLNTIIDLIEIENIAGIKDSSGNFIAFSKGLLETITETFTWIQGEDHLDAASYLIGAKGVVTGLGNICIKPYIEMNQSAKSGNYFGVKEAQRKIYDLYHIIESTPGNSISAIKVACSILNRSTSYMRISALDLTNGEQDRIKQKLVDLELL